MFQSLFYQPIFNVLVFLYNIVPGHDFGLAVICLTIFIKLILWPLSKKAITSQKKITELQPEIDKLKEKYKDQKEEMGKALLNLYKEKKVNPFSSCFPILIQLPFLFAVFKVFKEGSNPDSLNLIYSFILRPENINHISLNFIDLSHPVVWLAVASGISQFWQTKDIMNKAPKINESKENEFSSIMQKQTLYVFPVLTVFIGLSLPGGLSLYWLVGNLINILQQKITVKSKNSIPAGN